MKKSYLTDHARAMIREMFHHGVSNANIATFLNDCGFEHPKGHAITEDHIRGICRKMGLRRPPGWNLNIEAERAAFNRRILLQRVLIGLALFILAGGLLFIASGVAMP
jgi:hypothetical protein